MRRYYFLIAGIFVAALFVDAPMTGITFVGDDALRANIDGWIAIHHGHLLAAFRQELFREDFSSGRFHPLFIALTLLEMHLVHDPFPLKLVQLLAVGLNVATVAFVVREVSDSTARAAAAALFAVLMLQMRNVVDATNGDTLHLQITAEFGLLAVGLLAYSLRQKGWLRSATYGASVLSFAATLLLYEVMAPLIVPLLVLSAAGQTHWRRRAARALPFVAVLLADVFAVLAVRHAWPQAAGSFYAPNLGPAYFYALFDQVVSTVPLLYEAVDPQALFHANGTYWPLTISAALAVLVAALGWRLTRTSDPRPTNDRRITVLLATGLAFFGPAVLIAASPVYQQLIRFGLPYATVYFQGFGLSIVAAACLPERFAPPAALRAFTAAFALALLVLFISNVVVAAQFHAFTYARRTIVDGLSHGAASIVPSGAFVYLDRSYYWVNDNSYYGQDDASQRGPLLWDSRYFYRLWSGRSWQTRPLEDEKLHPGQTAYEIRSVANDARHGTLIVQKVRGRAGEAPPAIVAAIVYERGSRTDTSPVPTVASEFGAQDFVTLARAADWRLSAFVPHCTALSNDALDDDAPSAARIVYGRGFLVAEEDGQLRFRWAGRQADLAVVNDTAAPLVTELPASIETVGPARGTVTVTSQAGEQQIEISDRPMATRISVSLPPKSSAGIRFQADAPNVAISGDPRDLRFRLIDSTLADRAGCGAKDAST